MKKVVILGSSAHDGQTKKAVDMLHSFTDFKVIDLNDFNVSYYNYQHSNADDDFMELMRKIINNYDTLIFATPVYWYSMSGIMKVFFDRITDLLDHEKELGSKLRTKNMAVLTSSVGDHLGENFWLPFIATANYLGMKYLGNLHTIENKYQPEDLKKFADTIDQKTW
ncbi:MAG: NAD(P)H-dependent oxidoreductase [Ginsengibacter sp.]